MSELRNLDAKSTSILVATAVSNSGKTRARLTNKSLKVISGRDTLPAAFILELQRELVDYQLAFHESSSRGGFVIFSIPALDGAPILKAATHLPGIRSQLVREETSFEDLRAELLDELFEAQDDEDD